MNRFKDFLTACALLLLFACLPNMAIAQQMDVPIPRTINDLTLNSVCGARAVGLYNGSLNYALEYQSPGLQVGADGYWRACPAWEGRPILPLPCEPSLAKTHDWLGADGSKCSAPTVAGWTPHGFAKVLRSSSAATGPTDGLAILQCSNGALTVTNSNCGAKAACEGSVGPATTDGGKTWFTFTGRIPEGATGVAVSSTGATRPIACTSGVFVLR